MLVEPVMLFVVNCWFFDDFQAFLDFFPGSFLGTPGLETGDCQARAFTGIAVFTVWPVDQVGTASEAPFQQKGINLRVHRIVGVNNQIPAAPLFEVGTVMRERLEQLDLLMIAHDLLT